MAQISPLLAALQGAQYTPDESPLGIGAIALGQAAPMLYNPYASTGKNAAYTIGAGLLSGILGGLAKREANTKNAELFSAMNAMRSSPNDIEGIVQSNPRLANVGLMMMQDQMDKQAEREAQQAAFQTQLQFEKQKMQELMPIQMQQQLALSQAEAIGKNPYAADDITAAYSKIGNQFGALPQAEGLQPAALPSAQPEMPSTGAILQDALGGGGIETPVPVSPETKVNLQSALNQSPNSTASRYQELLKQTKDPAIAKDLFKSELELQQKGLERATQKQEEQNKTIAEHLAQESTKYSENKNIIDNLDYAISNAGETGGIDSLRGLKTYGSYLLGSEKAAKELAGRKTLNTIGLDMAGKIKDMFPGPVANAEMNLYMKSAAGTGNALEENIALKQKMQRANELRQQYISFVEEASKQGLSLSDAKLAYNKFDSAVPTFVSTESGLEVNPDKLALDPSSLDMRQLMKASFSSIQKKNEIAPSKMDISSPPAIEAPERIGGPVQLGNKDSVMLSPSIIAPQTNTPSTPTPASAALDPSGIKGVVGKTGLTTGEALTGTGLAALDTLTLGMGDEITAGGSALLDSLMGGPGYDARLSQTRDLQERYKQASPITDLGVRMAAGAGLPAAGVLKAGKGLIGGMTKASITGAGYGAAYGYGEGEGGVSNRLDEAKSGAAFGAVAGPAVNVAGKAISGIANMAEGVSKKLFGIGRADYNQVAKSFSKNDVTQAKQSVGRALSIIEKEQGVPLKDTVRTGEQFYIDMFNKAKTSQQARQEAVNRVIDQVDETLYKGANKYIKLTPEDVLKGQRVGEYEKKVLRKAIATQLKEYNGMNNGKGMTLKDMQLQKQLLNRSYKTQEEANASKAITDAMRNRVDQSVMNAAENGAIPKELGNTVSKLNKESRDLINLMNIYGKKIPSEAGQDALSAGQRMFYTTGSGGVPGMGQVAENISPGSGKFANMLGLLGQSTPIIRPIAYGASKYVAPYADKLGQSMQGQGPVMAGLASLDKSKEKDIAAMLDLPKASGNTPASIQQFLKQSTPETVQPRMQQAQQPSQQNKANVFDMPFEQAVNTRVPMKQNVSALIKQQPPLIQAIISVESAGKHDAVSKAGARGLMQVMPANLKKLGVTDHNDPVQNIKAGVAIIQEEMQRFQDPRLALAAYNAGSPRVNAAIKRAGSRDWYSVAPYLPEETRAYVPKVLSKFKQFTT